MPSLNALGEFKFSFNNIANEKNAVTSQELPFDDLALPDTEAPPFDFSSSPSPDSGDSPAEGGVGDFDFGALLNSVSGEETPPSIDNAFQDITPSPVEDSSSDSGPPSDDTMPDFESQPSPTDESSPLESSPTDESSALEPLDDFPNDLIPPADEPAADDTSFLDEPQPGPADEGETPSDTSGEVEDNFSVPDELLSGLSEEIESAPSDLGSQEEQSEDSGTENVPSEDLGSDDFLSGTGAEDSKPEDAVDAGGESPVDSSDAEDVAGSQDTESQDSGDLPDFDFPEPDTASEPESVSDGELAEGLDLGGESQDTPVSDTESTGGDTDLNDKGVAGGEEAGSDFSLDLPDVDFSGTEETSPGSDFDSSLPDIDFSGTEEAGADSDIGSPLPDIDLSGTEEASSDSDIGSPLPDVDFSGTEEAGSDSDIGSSLPDFDFTGMDESPDSGAAEEGAKDADVPDFKDIGADFESGSVELSSEKEAQGGDDFALPGLEEIFDKTKIETISTQPAAKKRLFGGKKAKTDELPEAEVDIEELSLSQKNVDELLRTLASYPLNLRIACEEIIAEQVILPQQLTKLVRLLVNGANVKETAAHVEQILGKPIVIPKSFEKMTGAAFEAEQASFAYIFMHNFLPVLRLFAVIAALAASVVYLGYKFVYIPLRAESLYKRGYERIPEGEYQRANELFHDAFVLHRNKKWFFLYAEAFRDERRYMLAESKYDELLRYYPRDKQGVLDYANLETYYLLNYDKANRLLQRELLDYAPNDYEALLAAGDNFFAWADSDPSRFYDRYEDARFSYARLLELYGWQSPVVERMMKYFIRTDNLKEVLYIRVWFENDYRRRLSTESLAELGGYLLDKQLEKPQGVPNPYVESIESVRDMLLEAVREEPTLPEPHYHLARYYHNLGNVHEERLTLENAIRAFNLAKTESVRRRLYRVDTYYRYANLLIENREFFPAEEQLIRGIELYEDFLSRNLIPATPQLGQLYAAKGDLEYFVKLDNMEAALNNYRTAERYGYAPPEIQYRMGSAYYHLENWRNALEYLFKASADLPLNRRMLFALGNATYKRGDYFAAEGYYNRLLDILENQRVRLPVLFPNDSPQFIELGERLMMARNNAGVVYEALAEQTGNREYRSKAMALYAESARAWDSITRNPETMTRMRLFDSPGVPGINLGFLNANNALRPNSEFGREIFIRIDRDAIEPSRWEELAPFGGLID